MNYIEKPWGHEEIITEINGWRIKKLVVEEGHRTSKQYHNEKFEIWFFIDGTYKLIRPNQLHRINGPCVVLEAAYGSDDDVVRVEDDYNR